MQQAHLPTLGARCWTALCLASIFGANMGDLFARAWALNASTKPAVFRRVRDMEEAWSKNADVKLPDWQQKGLGVDFVRQMRMIIGFGETIVV